MALIKLIVITHSHFDHCGSASAIRDLTEAKIAIHESERECVEHDKAMIPKGANWKGKIIETLIFSIKVPFTKFCPDILLNGESYPLSKFGIDG